MATPDVSLLAGILQTGFVPGKLPPLEDLPADARPFYQAAKKLLDQGLNITTTGWEVWLPQNINPQYRQQLQREATKSWDKDAVRAAAQALDKQLALKDLKQIGELQDHNNPEQLIAQAIQLTEKARVRLTARATHNLSLGTATEDYITQITTITPHATPFTQLNSQIGGLWPGRVIILAARPGVGKSLLALQIAMAAQAQIPVYYLTLEMSAAELAGRAVAQIAGISPYKMQHGLTEQEAAVLQTAKQELQQANITIDQTTNKVEYMLDAAAAQLGMQHGLLIVDYLQLLDIIGSGRKKRYETVGEISRRLKTWALSTNNSVLAVSSLNRSGEEDNPTLFNLKDADAIGYDADIVLMMWLANTDFGVYRKLKVEKNRVGSSGGIITLGFNEDRLSFHEVDDMEDVDIV